MMTWEIFLGIGALVSIVIAISGPLLKLNTSIIKLNASVDTLKEAIDRIDKDNEKNHKEIWDHNDEQDEQLKNHEKRINDVENIISFAERLGILKGGVINTQ